MKKLLLLTVCVALLASCGNKAQNESLKAQNDSLNMVLAERDAELEGIMEAFNEVQEGFRLINEAENRVDLQGGVAEGASVAQKVREDILFISEKLQANRDRIAELENQLKESKYASSQLKKTIANYKKELEVKTQQIETLQAELASKNIRIAELDDAVNLLNQNVSDLTATNKKQGEVMAAQDKLLQKTKVLEGNDFDKNYFTQIDIRTDKEIKLFSPSAKLLTTHPEGTYELVKDEKGLLTLAITNPGKFWSVSRYLVIEVK